LGTAHAHQGQKMGGKAIFGLKMVLKHAGTALLGKNTDFWVHDAGLHVLRRRNYTHPHLRLHLHLHLHASKQGKSPHHFAVLNSS
jgi:hypothetical protein